jgi:hypothetical protein
MSENYLPPQPTDFRGRDFRGYPNYPQQRSMYGSSKGSVGSCSQFGSVYKPKLGSGGSLSHVPSPDPGFAQRSHRVKEFRDQKSRDRQSISSGGSVSHVPSPDPGLAQRSRRVKEFRDQNSNNLDRSPPHMDRPHQPPFDRSSPAFDRPLPSFAQADPGQRFSPLHSMRQPSPRVEPEKDILGGLP